MKKRRLLAFLLFLPITFAFGQKEADIWYFGINIGLNFSEGKPVPLTNSGMSQSEGTAVISDSKTGELLFYTDGSNAWNRNNQIMPNGIGLLGSNTCTQSALIVPYPNNPSQYYLFTVKAANDGDSAGLHYSIVDMGLNNGLGGIVDSLKNRPLLDSTTEKLTAIPHTNGRDYWVITHKWNSDAFYVYPLTANGVADPRIFQIGSVHNQSDGVAPSEAMGYLKASPDGKMLACAIYSADEKRPFEIFSFDATTGQISNPIILAEAVGLYGISFSPNNTKLYVSSWREGLFQFDLNSGTIEDIKKSRTKLTYIQQILGTSDTISPGEALQIGPDGKIYSAYHFFVPGRESRIAVINKPNEAGVACNLTTQEIFFENGAPSLGLPNLIQSTFNGLLPNNNPISDCDAMDGILLGPNPTNNFVNLSISQQCFQPYQLRIITMLGQIVQELSFDNPAPQIIDLRWLASAVYLIELQFSDGRKIIRKVVKHNQ